MGVGSLRIAMLSAHSCPVGILGTRDTGGMSVYIRELARELAQQGHLVDVYTRVHDPEDRQVYELSANARLVHLRAGEDEEIDKLAVYSHLPELAHNLESFRSESQIRYDLIFSHYWLSGLAGTFLQQWWDVPHIIMFHTLGAIKNAVKNEAVLAPAESEPDLRIRTEKALARNCHHIIASTEKEREQLTRSYGARPEKISIVPCGVNLEQFRPMDKAQARQHLGFDEEKIILFVGRIDPLKGIDSLIAALPHLSDIRALRLLIIGGGEGSQSAIERLRALASQLGVVDKVSFMGVVKHERLPHFYSLADVCVVPSYYESFGLVALEALACGTPVVATDVGTHRSVIREGETGYVVADNAPGTLARKIALVLSRPDAGVQSAFAARASVTGFGWPSIAEAMSRCCRTVLDGYLASVS